MRMSATDEMVVSIAPRMLPRGPEGLRVLVLPDGNGRRGSTADYTAGGQKVIEVAEHLAARGDVQSLYICLVSPENVEKRPPEFFLALRDAFCWLRRRILSDGVLVRARVRARVKGATSWLSSRGPEGAAAVEALLSAAAAAQIDGPPRLWLDFGVAYTPQVAIEENVDLLFRSGMEEENVVRLSGIEPPSDAVVACATTLWPDLDRRALDAFTPRVRTGRRFEAGHTAEALAEVAALLLRAGPVPCPARIQATVIDGTAEIVEASSRRLGLITFTRDGSTVGVQSPSGGPPIFLEVRPAPREPAPSATEPDGIVLPGQLAPLLLPRGAPVGYANLFGCGETAADIAGAVRRALVFSIKHPALHGGPRSSAPPALAAAPEAPRARRRIEAANEAWTPRMSSWAEQRGLWLDTGAFRTATASYVLTAVGIVGPGDGAPEASEPDRHSLVQLLCEYMLIVAAGDEGIFDARRAGDDDHTHFVRVTRASEHIVAGLRPPANRQHEDPLVGATLAAWQTMLDQWQSRSHPDALVLWQRGLTSMYQALALEQAPDLRDRLAAVAAPKRRVPGARSPAGVGLVRRYLDWVAVSIGAGQLFRTAALAAPPAEVTSRRLAALDRAARALDRALRLANDLSGWQSGPHADRDLKETTVTLMSRAGRAGVSASAAEQCQKLAALARTELAAEIRDLRSVWPRMALLFRRGAFIGSRVYQRSHYTTITLEEMAIIHDELERDLVTPSRDAWLPERMALTP